ncbi:MAG: lipase maturation factor family protein [Candidatus Melainabacteria bacterium]|nr:MAG: lipase maturation factor family protein [Candidatus Melainabacteria bacterium]
MTGESDEAQRSQFLDEGKTDETLLQNPEALTCAGKASFGFRDERTGDGSLPVVCQVENIAKKAESYALCRFMVVRGVALVYLIAFLSLFLQIDGLFSQKGILPIAQSMDQMVRSYPPGGFQFNDLPTIFLISSSDSFLKGACIAGMIAALTAALGLLSGLMLLVCWALYISFLSTGADFMSFQWDILLLEAGMLAALWAPWAMASPPLQNTKGADGPPSLILLWLLRWLLFRLMFMSGMCKLMSGDEAWSSLTALAYHYETQPLPTPLAWFCNLLPLWFQQLSCLLMFGIEIFCPFLISGNKLSRRIAFGALAGLQVLILLSGNYTFFNLLSIILCFTLIEDSLWRRIFPGSLRTSLENAASITNTKWQLAQRIMVLPMVAILGLANLCLLVVHTTGGEALPASLREFVGSVRPLHLVNSYGLFAVMTQKRIEIVLEGSNDGKEWVAYEFPFKPGDLHRPPPIVAPMQPRLDWQMWFAALGTVEQNPWFTSFVQKILEGDKAVTALLSKNPFPDKPPRFLRAQSYEYHFTDVQELMSKGTWWKRTYVGEYMPVVTLENQLEAVP